MDLMKHHREIGKVVGRGTVEIDGQERQALLLATDDRHIVAYPIENVLPATSADVVNALFADMAELLEKAAFLGLSAEEMQRAFSEALQEAVHEGAAWK